MVKELHRIVDQATVGLTPEERATRVGIMRQAMREAAQDPEKARAELERHTNPDPIVNIPEPYIPSMFAHVTLNGFKAGIAGCRMESTQSQRTALEAVLDWRRRVVAKEPAMLALIGPTGVGKSHLLYAAVRSLVKEGIRVYSQPWYNLADSIRYGGPSAWNPTKILEAHAIRTEVKGERIVCLDDVRPTAGTAFDDTELGKIILDAWDRQSAMLITTNVCPLTDVISPPLASRFTQVVMTGHDRRRDRTDVSH